jgi:hypothetical protein
VFSNNVMAGFNVVEACVRWQVPRLVNISSETTVTLTRPLSASVARDLRFDPWNTGRSMQPAGYLNRIRRPVYEASQNGRAATPDGARHRLARPTS